MAMRRLLPGAAGDERRLDAGDPRGLSGIGAAGIDRVMRIDVRDLATWIDSRCPADGLWTHSMPKLFSFALAFTLLALPVDGFAQVKSSAREERSTAADDPSELYARFERELKRALADADPIATALLVSFPLRINLADGGRIDIGNAAALQTHFELAFPSSVRAAIVESDSRRGFIAGRFLMADGTLWLDRIDHGNGPRLRVAIVNVMRQGPSTVAYPRLMYACETIKHRIVVEQTGAEEYRYRSWNLPAFPPATPSLQMTGSASWEGTAECGHATYAFKRGDTRIDLSEPGCGKNNWPEGQLTVTINDEPAGDWMCE